MAREVAPNGRRAVVTGAAGFIGSNLVDRLLSEGWTVTGIDSFDPYYPRSVKERNLEEANRNSRFRLVETDTRDASALSIAFSEARPEVVIDFAARSGVRPSIADPEIYVDVNVRGLQNTISAAAASGSRFVFASSSSVYGADDRTPFAEDQMQGRPESPYAATKIAGEALLHAHHRATGLPTAITRLFNVYGPRQRPDLAMYKFATRILRGDAIELFDGGNGVRDYTFVDDVADGILLLLDAPPGHHLVNLGSHRPIRTSDLLNAVESALGASAHRIPAPHQTGDVPLTYANIDRARELLGWEPRTSLEVGLGKFCDWFRGQFVPDQQDTVQSSRATPT